MTELKTLFIITVSTVRLLFPGMPASIGMPETAKPPAVKSLAFEVASDAAVSNSSKASVDVPAGLKIASPAQMQIDYSVVKPAQPDDGKTKLVEYWGSGRQIGGGQPTVTTIGAAQAKAEASAVKVPDKSDAYWPLPNSKPLDDAATLSGTYTLKTDYCGSTSITLGDEQNFLDPINITSADRAPDITKPIVVRWKPVPNAAGYVLRAVGGRQQETITWTSAAKPELVQGIEYRPLSPADLEKYVKEGVLMPSYVVSCTIPEGIFKDATSVILIVTAVGKDLVQIKDGIETQVIVRSTASVPLRNAPEPPQKPKNADRDKDEQ